MLLCFSPLTRIFRHVSFSLLKAFGSSISPYSFSIYLILINLVFYLFK